MKIQGSSPYRETSRLAHRLKSSGLTSATMPSAGLSHKRIEFSVAQRSGSGPTHDISIDESISDSDGPSHSDE